MLRFLGVEGVPPNSLTAVLRIVGGVLRARAKAKGKYKDMGNKHTKDSKDSKDSKDIKDSPDI